MRYQKFRHDFKYEKQFKGINSLMCAPKSNAICSQPCMTKFMISKLENVLNTTLNVATAIFLMDNNFTGKCDISNPYEI